MELTVEKHEDVTVVCLDAESLDSSNVKAFKKTFRPSIEPNAKVVLNLQHLQFVDSSGLGALLSCLRQLNGFGGGMKLCSMTKQVRALFELVRMHRIFDIYNTAEEAVRSFTLGISTARIA